MLNVQDEDRRSTKDILISGQILLFTCICINKIVLNWIHIWWDHLCSPSEHYLPLSGYIINHLFICFWSYHLRFFLQMNNTWIRNFSLVWVLVINCVCIDISDCAETKGWHSDGIWYDCRGTKQEKRWTRTCRSTYYILHVILLWLLFVQMLSCIETRTDSKVWEHSLLSWNVPSLIPSLAKPRTWPV